MHRSPEQNLQYSEYSVSVLRMSGARIGRCRLEGVLSPGRLDHYINCPPAPPPAPTHCHHIWGTHSEDYPPEHRYKPTNQQLPWQISDHQTKSDTTITDIIISNTTWPGITDICELVWTTFAIPALFFNICVLKIWTSICRSMRRWITFPRQVANHVTGM